MRLSSLPITEMPLIMQKNEDGSPNTAHSVQSVPCVYVSENTNAVVENGRLDGSNYLETDGFEAPKEMTGKVLVK